MAAAWSVCVWRKKPGSSKARKTRYKAGMSSTYGNNVGFLRLVLASCVIIGHAPELVDGNLTHEPMTMLFHTLSLGEMAVDGFFLLSGYLVTASLLRAPHISIYLIRRLARLYPAFWVISLLLTFGLGPALGMPFGIDSLTLLRFVVLMGPPAAPVAYLHYKVLDGPMWTLPCEMHCYLLVALLYRLGFFRHRELCLGLAVVLAACVCAHGFGLLAYNANTFATQPWLFYPFLIFSLSDSDLRLTSCFLLGGSAWLYRAELSRHLHGGTSLAALTLAVLCLSQRHLAEAGLQIFGGLALYWLAFKANLGVFQRLNNNWDISYGTYLYGWPVSLCLLI